MHCAGDMYSTFSLLFRPTYLADLVVQSVHCSPLNFQGGSVSFHLETQKMVIRAQTVTGVQTPACIRPRISYNSHYSLIFLSEKPANQWMSFSSGLREIV